MHHNEIVEDALAGYLEEVAAEAFADVDEIGNTSRKTTSTLPTATRGHLLDSRHRKRDGVPTPLARGWSGEAWITIVSGASGTGNGVVTMAVRSNNSNTGRRGTITIAGRTVTIIQGRTLPAPSR